MPNHDAYIDAAEDAANAGAKVYCSACTWYDGPRTNRCCHPHSAYLHATPAKAVTKYRSIDERNPENACPDCEAGDPKYIVEENQKARNKLLFWSIWAGLGLLCLLAFLLTR